MASRDAGDLFHKVEFSRRETVNDGFGNTMADWIPAFAVRAGYTHLRGGEAVMAGRLQGRHTVVIFVRAETRTRALTTDFRVRDVRTGETYNIRDITPTDDRQWVDLLCESGVVDG